MTVTPTRIQVGTTNPATTLMAAAGTPGSSNRRSITIYNKGPNEIVLGTTNAVTLATGFPVPAGGALTLDKDASTALFAICSVLQVSPADTGVLTESGT